MNRETPPEEPEDDPAGDGPQEVVRYHLSFDSETMARLEDLRKRLATMPEGTRISIELPRRGGS